MGSEGSSPIEVYLEVGAKRVFAGAIAWPGWCRSGRTESEALDRLFAYGSRYAAVLEPARIPFEAPWSAGELRVDDRIDGDATTDFGAPGKAPADDARPLEGDDLRRYVATLEASWAALDRAVERAAGRELRRGPRGGGRDLETIVSHVRDAQASYVQKLGWQATGSRVTPTTGDDVANRAFALEAVAAMAPAGIPEPGPRGGLRWSARYFIRRAAWHVLDHAWEIEDRLTDAAP